MIARDWILDTLAELELWYWPIFFWELYWLDQYLRAREAENRAGLVGYGVTRQRRIHITLHVYGDEPDPNDWTIFAPRAPWTRLAPEAGPFAGPSSTALGCLLAVTRPRWTLTALAHTCPLILKPPWPPAPLPAW